MTAKCRQSRTVYSTGAMSLFGRRDDPPPDDPASDTTANVSPGTRRRLAARAIDRRLALSAALAEDEEDDDSKQDEQAKRDEQRRRQMEEDEAFARRLQEAEERAAANRAEPALTRSEIAGILSSDDSSEVVDDDDPMPRRAPFRMSFSPSPPRAHTGATLSARTMWQAPRGRIALSPLDSSSSTSSRSASPLGSRTPSTSPARSGSPRPNWRVWTSPRQDGYVRSIPSLLPRATAPHPTPQVAVRRAAVASSRPAPLAAAPTAANAPRRAPILLTSGRALATPALPTSAATTSALGVTSRNAALAPTRAAPFSTATGYLPGLAMRGATYNLLRQLGHGAAVAAAPPTTAPPPAPIPAPAAPQNNVVPSTAAPSASSADDAAVAAGAPYAIVSGVRKVHRWDDKRTFRFAPGERLERVRGMRPVIYRRQTTGYKALPPPAPGVTYQERAVMHLVGRTFSVNVPSAAASAQTAQTSAGLVTALGLPPATAALWGDCCICFDEAHNPVGCQSCKQLVGCEDCVCMWYGMAGAAGSASVGAHRSCPLCRFEWRGVPQVARMEDLQE